MSAIIHLILSHFRTSWYISGISLINLSFIFAFVGEEGDAHDRNASILVVAFFTLANWIAAVLPHVFKHKKSLTSFSANLIVTWHILCIAYGIVDVTLMAPHALQVIKCCVVSFEDAGGFTRDMDFLCHSYDCNYWKVFVVLPFISVVWSAFSVHYQVYNIFRFLHDSQQEAESYDRLIQRLTSALREGGPANSTAEALGNFNLDGIILANETVL